MLSLWLCLFALDELDEADAMYRPELPVADEDSQASFNADEFFMTSFQLPQSGASGEGEPGAMLQTDVINNDLQLSDSDDMEDDQPSEGVGFDFDEFED